MIYMFHNIHIEVKEEITEIISDLEKELGKNSSLDDGEQYYIAIYQKNEFEESMLDGAVRLEYHPFSEKQFWQSEQALFEISEPAILMTTGDNRSIIYLKDFSDIYIYLRSKLCEIIRKRMLVTYPLALHSGLISKNNNYYLIIGDKSAGKTSSIMNAYFEGYEVYTDELVFIDNENITSLKRYPALSKETLETYFKNYRYKVHRIISGIITGEEKYIFSINRGIEKDIALKKIKKIFVLMDNRNKYSIKKYTYQIFEKNLVYGNTSSDIHTLINDLQKKINVTTVSKFQSILSNIDNI